MHPIARVTLLAAAAVLVADAREGSSTASAAPSTYTVVAALPQGSSEEADRIADSLKVLRELVTTPDNNIPKHLLERSEAIVVIPSLVKGGFIVGAKHGKGVLSVKTGGAWSPPAFVTMTGGSVGWQIGLQTVDLVLLVMNRKGVDALLEDKFTLGGEASVAAGPLGRSASAATDAQVTAQILAYSRAKGLFAGATLEGAALRADNDSNRHFYGREVRIRNIVTEMATLPGAHASATTWRDALRGFTK